MRADILKTFPVLGEDDINNLVPLKEDVSCMKIFTHKGDAVKSYMASITFWTLKKTDHLFSNFFKNEKNYFSWEKKSYAVLKWDTSLELMNVHMLQWCNLMELIEKKMDSYRKTKSKYLMIILYKNVAVWGLSPGFPSGQPAGLVHPAQCLHVLAVQVIIQLLCILIVWFFSSYFYA